MNYLGSVATDRLYMSDNRVSLTTYDTEGHMDKDRLNYLASNVTEYICDEPTYSDVWSVYGKESLKADEFEDMVKQYILKDKRTSKYTAFINRMTKEPLVVPVPKILILDSFSQFSSTITDDAINKAGEKGKETIYLKDGLYKARYIDNVLNTCNTGNIYYIMSAHLGEGIDLSGMFEVGPLKKAQFLRGNTKIKKVPDNFLSMATHAMVATPSLLKDSKGIGPEYPTKVQTELIRDKKVTKELTTELQLITLTTLRNMVSLVMIGVIIWICVLILTYLVILLEIY